MIYWRIKSNLGDIMTNNPTVVSLFAGAGGMDKGFVNAGFDILWANDFEKDAVETYKKI